MTPEEQNLLTHLFDRLKANGAAPRDPSAEAFINASLAQMPYAPYLLAQTVLVHEHTLAAAGARIQALEAELAQARTPPSAPAPSFLGNLGASLFGSPAPAAAPRPEPRPLPGAAPWGAQQPAPAAPPPQAGPWGAAPAQAAAPSFLHSALTTATGVAGGMLAANALRGLFGGNSFMGSGMMNPGYGMAMDQQDALLRQQLADADATQDRMQDQLDDANQQLDDQQDASQDTADDSGGQDDFGSSDA
ncbi:MAG: DUF2076 family protein [Hyphomicrobiales bacterium]|nr:DUF2076 family protein [Hyphomicrobiales bacterium]